MAIYHCSVKVISRSQGRSSVASSAYRSGEELTNERDGITHDYTRKQGIAYTEIMLADNAPKEFQNRQTLWNAVEQSENRINSQTAREIEVALPQELNRQEQIKLIEEYTKDNFVNRGMCADIAIHDKEDGNPHAHIMLTTREVDKEGFTNKNRDWNSKELLNEWRKNWAEKTNQYLEKNNISNRVDHRSFEEQGIDKLPTKHLGTINNQLEKNGVKTKVGDYNREVEKINQELEQSKNDLSKIFSQEKPQEQFKQVELKQEPVKQEPPKGIDTNENKTLCDTQRQSVDLNQIKTDYIKVELQYKQVNSSLQDSRNDLRQNQNFIKQAQKGQDKVHYFDKQIADLEKEKAEIKGFFKGNERKAIETKLEFAREDRNNVVKELKANGIDNESVKQAYENIKVLEPKIQKVEDSLSKLNIEKSKLEFNYKYNKALERLEGKEPQEIKNFEPDSNSLKDRLTIVSAEEKLNYLDSKDIQKIMERLPDKYKKDFSQENNTKIKVKHREIDDLER